MYKSDTDSDFYLVHCSCAPLLWSAYSSAVSPHRCLVHRAMYEKSLQAFVSFIQSYAKHECHLIFQVKGEPTPQILAAATMLHLLMLQNWT